MIIHICPECKGYLPPMEHGYKYCVHCGISLAGKKLLETEIPDNMEKIDVIVDLDCSSEKGDGK